MNYLFLAGFASLAILSFALSAILTPLCARLASKLGMVDNPGQRKIHTKAKPYGGGLSIALSMTAAGAITLLFILPQFESIRAIAPDCLTKALPSGVGPDGYSRIAGVAIGAAIIFLTGLIDDLRPLPAKTKLIMQIIAAAITWYCGIRITLFIDSQIFSFIITVGWLVVLTNSFNLLDNMDGLSSGVALLCGLHLMLLTAYSGHFFQPAFLSIFCGALAGFLLYNFSPAKLFLGDAGSLLIGYILATLAAAGTYAQDYTHAHAVLVPLLIMGVPIFDTLSVIIIRIRAGKPIYHGDTNHLSHRLCQMGFSKRQSVLLIYLLAMIFGQCSFLIRNLSSGDASAVFIICLMIVTLMASLMTAKANKE